MNQLSEEEMYEAVIRNDADYDGVFFYGVKSTGIFCRPSCTSKKPKRENVVFFSDAEEAMKAGYRPCKRCRSDLLIYHPMKEMAMQLRQHLERLNSEESEWHDQIIGYGISERRMVEIFRKEYGITPKAYMDQLRLKEAERLLSETEEKVIDIAEAAGFRSVVSFNRFFRSETGQTPTEYRSTHRKSGR